MDVVDDRYVYVVPERVVNASVHAKKVQSILEKYGFYEDEDRIKALFFPQEKRYVRILTNANTKIAKMIKDAKLDFFDEKTDGIPLFHAF